MKVSCILVIGIVVLGCEKERTYLVKFKEIDHLSTDTQVISAGVPVGSVRSLTIIEERSVLAEVEIANDMNMNLGYKVALVPFDSFGTNAIELIPSTDEMPMSELDTIVGIKVSKAPIQQIDSLLYKIVNDSVLKLKRTE